MCEKALMREPSRVDQMVVSVRGLPRDGPLAHRSRHGREQARDPRRRAARAPPAAGELRSPHGPGGVRDGQAADERIVQRRDWQ